MRAMRRCTRRPIDAPRVRVYTPWSADLSAVCNTCDVGTASRVEFMW